MILVSKARDQFKSDASGSESHKKGWFFYLENEKIEKEKRKTNLRVRK